MGGTSTISPTASAGTSAAARTDLTGGSSFANSGLTSSSNPACHPCAINERHWTAMLSGREEPFAPEEPAGSGPKPTGNGLAQQGAVVSRTRVTDHLNCLAVPLSAGSSVTIS